MEQMPHRDVRRHEHRHARRHEPAHDPNAFFGIDVEKMSPKAQVTTGLAVILPVVLSGIGLYLADLLPFWFIYFWVIFPAFGLLVRGIAGLSDSGTELSAASSKERELLEALREYGELAPARAAMETSLTVSEADEMLKGLAEGGHLEVRVRAGGLFYSLWEPEGVTLEPGEKV